MYIIQIVKFTEENCPEIDVNFTVLINILHKKCLALSQFYEIDLKFGTIFLIK